jgi:hypothetical protein
MPGVGDGRLSGRLKIDDRRLAGHDHGLGDRTDPHGDIDRHRDADRPSMAGRLTVAKPGKLNDTP